MPDKGRIMSQTFYERQTKLFNLYKESYIRNEKNVQEAVSALRTLGFSGSIAAIRVNEWKEQSCDKAPETDRQKKRRQKEQASIEKYFDRMSSGKRNK